MAIEKNALIALITRTITILSLEFNKSFFILNPKNRNTTPTINVKKISILTIGIKLSNNSSPIILGRINK